MINDLNYFIIFCLINKSLPVESGLVKGLVFGIIIWFFRVLMQVASQWMMYDIPLKALFFTLICGLVEMLVLGLFFGLTLKATP